MSSSLRMHLLCFKGAGEKICGRGLRGSLSPIAEAGAQFVDDLLRGLACMLPLPGLERDGADAGVPAAAIAFADLRQVDHVLRLRPRIRADGDFHAERALAQTDAVDAVRMQVVRHELVVALER